MDPRAADLFAYFLVITKLAAIVEPTAPSKSGAAEGRPSERGIPAASFPSGEYVRNISFTMRAVTSSTQSLRIPSPMPGTVPRSAIPRILPHPSQRDSVRETEVTSEASAARCVSEAELQYAAGRRERALLLVRRALTLAPGFPRAVALLAYLEAVATIAGQDAYLQSLLKMIEAAMVKEDKCRRARFYRAEIRKRLGDHEGALRDLRAAIRDDPDDIDANRELNAYERKIREGAIILKSTRG
jgi:tetratricopeptide (TPR) repeat protein